jgi:hypothetical protein
MLRDACSLSDLAPAGLPGLAAGAYPWSISRKRSRMPPITCGVRSSSCRPTNKYGRWRSRFDRLGCHSASDFAVSGPDVTKFFRTTDQPSLALFLLRRGQRLVGEALYRTCGELSRCFPPRMPLGSGSESLFDKAADRLRKRRLVILIIRPRADLGFESAGKAHGSDGVSAGSGATPLFWYYRY